jgi:hypothetical protein
MEKKWFVVVLGVSVVAIVTAAIPILVIYLRVDFPLDEKIDQKIVFFLYLVFFVILFVNLSVYPLQTPSPLIIFSKSFPPSILPEMFYFRH